MKSLFIGRLIQNESAVRELGDNNLRELAKYITEQLRKNTTVDWAKRDSVRARLRNLVRRALSRWKYPPDKAEEAVDLCLKQAEVLSETGVRANKSTPSRSGRRCPPSNGQGKFMKIFIETATYRMF